MAKNVKMRSLFHCVYALTYQLIVVTKYRRACITRPMLEMLQDIVGQRCKDGGGELREFNGGADHVHALLSLPPNLDLSRFVNNVKTTSSRFVRLGPPAQHDLSQARFLVAIVLHHFKPGFSRSIIEGGQRPASQAQFRRFCRKIQSVFGSSGMAI
jgi:REP element-mobilizing transposase RayT